MFGGIDPKCLAKTIRFDCAVNMYGTIVKEDFRRILEVDPYSKEYLTDFLLISLPELRELGVKGLLESNDYIDAKLWFLNTLTERELVNYYHTVGGNL